MAETEFRPRRTVSSFGRFVISRSGRRNRNHHSQNGQLDLRARLAVPMSELLMSGLDGMTDRKVRRSRTNFVGLATPEEPRCYPWCAEFER
jgi:hypothetical protein